MSTGRGIGQVAARHHHRTLTDRVLRHPNLLLLATLGSVLLVTRFALGNDRPFVYPAGGQTEKQMADDRYACHREAVDRSGFDPVHAALAPALRAAPVTVAIPANEAEGTTARGLFTGAVAGGVIGAATDNEPGEFAVAGAVLGSMIGGAIESDGARKAEEAANAEAAARMRDQQSKLAAAEARREAYRLVFSACMEARDYIVR